MKPKTITKKINLENTPGVWLEISEEQQKITWKKTENYSFPGNKWQAYLNQLTLTSVLAWLVEDFDWTVSVWKNDKLSSIWEFITGSKIIVEQQEIVIIPCLSVSGFDDDDFEFAIPAEWVDIPDWTGDYYLPVEIDVEQGKMHIVGYVSYDKIKEKAEYDEGDRTYYLEQNDLILDPNVLLLSLKLSLEKPQKKVREKLQKISSNQAKMFLEKLGNPQIVLPKNQVNFNTWKALLANDEWREKMYQMRTIPLKVFISQWVNNIVNEGWKTVEEILGKPEPEIEMVARLRRKEKIDFSNAVKRGKEINLGIRLGGQLVSLVVSAKYESPEKTHIRLRVYPSSQTKNNYLPPNLKLSVLDEKRKPVLDEAQIPLEVISRSHDNWIQIQLYGYPGEEFSVKLSLNDTNVMEYFVI